MSTENESPDAARLLSRVTAFFAAGVGWQDMLLAAIIVSAVAFSGIKEISFNPDESGWISGGRALKSFLGGEWDDPIWGEHYWNLTAPPMVYYVTGLGRRFGGIGRDRVNERWRFNLTREENIAQGRMPDPDLLFWSRIPMAALTVIAGLVMMSLLSRAAGRWASYAFLISYVGNPWMMGTLRRAMGEAPLSFLVLSATTAAASALGAWDAAVSETKVGRRLLCALGWFTLAGLISGLAGATKLNGLLLVPAMTAPVLFVSFGARITSVSGLPTWAVVIGISVLLAVAACVAFLLVNPFLQQDPVYRFGRMLIMRVFEMRNQADKFPSRAIRDLGTRARVIWHETLQATALVRFAGSDVITLAVAAVGCWHLAAQAWGWVGGRAGDQGRVSLVLLLASLAIAAPYLATHMAWRRYFFYPALFRSAFASIGAAVVLTRVLIHANREPMTRS